jgi:hypothetical protein
MQVINKTKHLKSFKGMDPLGWDRLELLTASAI